MVTIGELERGLNLNNRGVAISGGQVNILETQLLHHYWYDFQPYCQCFLPQIQSLGWTMPSWIKLKSGGGGCNKNVMVYIFSKKSSRGTSIPDWRVDKP